MHGMGWFAYLCMNVAANRVAGDVEPASNFPNGDAVSDVPASNNSK